MSPENLNTLIEQLLKGGFSEEDLIFMIKSNSAKLALEKWSELFKEVNNSL